MRTVCFFLRTQRHTLTSPPIILKGLFLPPFQHLLLCFICIIALFVFYRDFIWKIMDYFSMEWRGWLFYVEWRGCIFMQGVGLRIVCFFKVILARAVAGKNSAEDSG